MFYGLKAIEIQLSSTIQYSLYWTFYPYLGFLPFFETFLELILEPKINFLLNEHFDHLCGINTIQVKFLI